MNGRPAFSEGEPRSELEPDRQLARPRFRLRRWLIGLAIAFFAAWVWACFFSDLDDIERIWIFFTGSCFGLFTLAILAFGLLVNPGDPPRPVKPTALTSPRHTIRNLMIAVTIAAVLFGLIRFISHFVVI
jgi:uncharacterized membrane protein